MAEWAEASNKEAEAVAAKCLAVHILLAVQQVVWEKFYYLTEFQNV